MKEVTKMNKVLFQIIKALHKVGFMNTKFYKKYCYNGKVGEFFLRYYL